MKLTKQIINILHAELVTMTQNGWLMPGQEYRIADFRTRYIIPGTTEYNVPVDTVNFEPLIVKALAKDELSREARSEAHPEDIIDYQLVLSVPDTINPPTKITEWPVEGEAGDRGWIWSRTDTINRNEFPYDFRAVVWRRWWNGREDSPVGRLNGYCPGWSRVDYYGGDTHDFSALGVGTFDIQVNGFEPNIPPLSGYRDSSNQVGYTRLEINQSGDFYRIASVTPNGGGSYTITTVEQQDFSYLTPGNNDMTFFADFLTLGKLGLSMDNKFANVGDKYGASTYYACINNIFFGSVNHSKHGGNFYDNTFNCYSHSNDFGIAFSRNKIWPVQEFQWNIFVDACSSNVWYGWFQHNKMGIDCNGSIFLGGAVNNVLEKFKNNVVGDGFKNNKINQNDMGATFGVNCESNTLEFPWSGTNFHSLPLNYPDNTSWLGTTSPCSVSHATLLSWKDAGVLIPGQKYTITDFQTQYLLPNGNGVFMGGPASTSSTLSAWDKSGSALFNTIVVGNASGEAFRKWPAYVGQTITVSGSTQDDGDYVVTELVPSWGGNPNYIGVVVQSADWLGSGVGDIIYTNNTYIDEEAIVVTAKSPTSLEPIAEPITSPEDILYYELDDLGNFEGLKGRITRRINASSHIDLPEDWRAIKYRRWEGYPGSGRWNVLTDNGGAFVDRPVFEGAMPASLKMEACFNGEGQQLMLNTVFDCGPDFENNSFAAGTRDNTFLIGMSGCNFGAAVIECNVDAGNWHEVTSSYPLSAATFTAGDLTRVHIGNSGLNNFITNSSHTDESLGGGIWKVTVEELRAMSGTWVAGQQYLLTNFRTRHLIPGTAVYNCDENDPTTYELLLVTASDPNNIHSEAISFGMNGGTAGDSKYDRIFYELHNSLQYDQPTSFDRGRIFRRVDTLAENDISEDFRACKYRRWVDNNGKYFSRGANARTVTPVEFGIDNTGQYVDILRTEFAAPSASLGIIDIDGTPHLPVAQDGGTPVIRIHSPWIPVTIFNEYVAGTAYTSGDKVWINSPGGNTQECIQDMPTAWAYTPPETVWTSGSTWTYGASTWEAIQDSPTLYSSGAWLSYGSYSRVQYNDNVWIQTLRGGSQNEWNLWVSGDTHFAGRLYYVPQPGGDVLGYRCRVENSETSEPVAGPNWELALTTIAYPYHNGYTWYARGPFHPSVEDGVFPGPSYYWAFIEEVAPPASAYWVESFNETSASVQMSWYNDFFMFGSATPDRAHCFNNTMETNNMFDDYQGLGNNVYVGSDIDNEYFYGNKFGPGSSENTFEGNNYNITLGALTFGNVFGGFTYDVTLDSHCFINTFIIGNHSINLGFSCGNNRFTSCEYITMGANCYGNVLSSCMRMKFSDFCYNLGSTPDLLYGISDAEIRYSPIGGAKFWMVTIDENGAFVTRSLYSD